MGIFSDSFRQGMRMTDQFKEKFYYLVYGVLVAMVFSVGGWKGFATFYIAMVGLDYIIMKLEGELE